MYTRLCKYGHVFIMDIYNQYALLYHDGCSKYQLSTRFGKFWLISWNKYMYCYIESKLIDELRILFNIFLIFQSLLLFMIKPEKN